MSEVPSNPERDRSTKIAELNDALRQHGEGGQVLVTHGVSELEDHVRFRLFQAIRDFDDFSEDNDPHLERDFGSVEIDGETYFFKHDAYDLNLEYGSPDASNPAVTKRVMTILRADEY